MPGIGVNQFTVGGDHVDPEHVLATPSPLARVPTLPTLEQVSADPNCRAMAAGKNHAVSTQERAELLSASDRRSRGRRHAVDVDGHLTQSGHVDQQRVVAHAPSRPRMTARSHGDLPTAFSRQSHGGDNVGITDRLQHRRRKSLGMASVEQRIGARRFVFGAAALDVVPFEHGHRDYDLIRRLSGSYSGRIEARAGYLQPAISRSHVPEERYADVTGSPASTITRPTAPPSVKPYEAART